jgi:CheY-like chemotaxis protein
MATDEKTGTSKRALVVDDSMLIRHVVTRFLEERGYTVETAVNGLEGLESLESFQPDLIVTDLNMPKMSGIEFIAVLKARPELATVPIVVIAGKKTDAVEEQLAPAQFVIYKDIDLETQLVRALATIAGMPPEK